MPYKDKAIKKEYMKKYYKNNKQKLLNQMKKYQQSIKGRNSKRKYKQSLKGKTVFKKYRENYPEKIKAQNFINNLLQNSDFTRDICTICGKSNTEFHHENYDLPYFGYWFCVEHHKEIHRSN